MFRQLIRVKMHAGTLYRALVTHVKPKSMVQVKSDSGFANSSGNSDKKSRKVAKSDLLNFYEKDTRQMLRKSSSKKLQQRLFSENVLAPKPLSGTQTNPIWNPYYFRDLGSVQHIQPIDRPTSDNAQSVSNFATNTQVSKMQQVLADLERTLRSSVSRDEQERIHTFAASGYGKTHLVHQYCLQHRALLMQFLTSSNSSLVHKLEAFIIEQRDKLKISSSLLADHATELNFTTVAFQSTSLLPLTFIEFAYQYFNYDPKFSKKEQWNEALLRTLNSRSYDLIGDMFAKNLKKYATNGAKFAVFKRRMYAAAKSMKLEAMIYDEIDVFEKLKGMFLHHPFNQPTAYTRLKEERDHIHKGGQLSDSPYSQFTSILYMLRIAMEDLVKEAGIPQLILSTHYSAAKLELPQVGVSARDRLKVQKFCWTESTDERWSRFRNELRTTLNFLEHKEVETKIVETLKPFAVRAVYLWPFWIILSQYMKSYKKSFAEIVSRSLELHKALVANRIKQYADALMGFKDQEWRDRFLLQIAVGRRYISGTQKDLNNLIQIGLIAVPEGLESLIQGVNDTTLVMIPLSDPFTLHYLEAEARQQFDRLLRKSAKWSIIDNGLFAEVTVLALLRQFKGKTLRALVTPGLGLEDNTLLDQFTIDECVTLRAYSDLDLTNQNNFLPNLAASPRDFLLSPSKSFFHTVSGREQHTREHAFVVGLLPYSNADAIVCIRSEYYPIITPSVAHAAIASLDPNNFYRTANAKLRASWEEMKRTVTKPHYWIRVIIGKAVTRSVVEAIAKHNRANPYQPILIVIRDLYIHEEADRLQYSNDSVANQLPVGVLNGQALQLTRYFDSTTVNDSDLNKLDPAGSSSK